MLKRRFTALSIVMAMIIAMLAPVQVSAASGDAPLVKSATSYSYDSDTKKWKKSSRNTVEYNVKGYPTDFKTVYFSSDSADFHSIKYKMKGSAPKSAKLVTASGRKSQKWTYKKGRLTKVKIIANPYNTYSKRTGVKKYSYNKKKLVSKYLYSYTTKYSNGDKYSGGWGYSYAYKMSKKGLPKSMTSTSLDEKGVSDGYKYYVEYNSRGLITKAYWVQSDGTKQLNNSYSYKIKKGKVTQVISYYYSNGTKYPDEKIVFKYTGTKVNKQRYANMINSLVCGTESSFGTYNWY